MGKTRLGSYFDVIEEGEGGEGGRHVSGQQVESEVHSF